MNEVEQAFADEIYQAIQDHSKGTERSQQAADFRLGISDIGYCPERNRRMLDHQVPDDTDLLPAWIGSALGEALENALLLRWPHAIKQAEVFLDIRVQGKAYRLPGHPDLLVPGWGVWDGKTDYGLNEVSRLGPTFGQLWQRNAYALAAWQDGLLGPMKLEDVQTGNIWIDRGAVQRRVEVNITPFDPDIIAMGMEEIESTVYAFMQGEEAEKRPPRQVCEVTCGFWKTCRQYDTDVHGLLDDPRLVFNVVSYYEGNVLEKQGKEMKDEAKVHLENISGSTGEHTVRWIWVNGSDDGKRKGYYRIEVKRIKKEDS